MPVLRLFVHFYHNLLLINMSSNRKRYPSARRDRTPSRSRSAHLRVCTVSIRAVVGHGKDCGHNAGAVSFAMTLNEHKLICSVVAYPQKLVSPLG